MLVLCRGLLYRLEMAAAIDTGSLNGIDMPFWFDSNSWLPPVGVSISGRPEARASSAALLMPSAREGRQKA